jgi:hypothetical protein
MEWNDETKENERERNETEDRPINDPRISGSAVYQSMDPRHPPKRASLVCNCNFQKRQHYFFPDKKKERFYYIIIIGLSRFSKCLHERFWASSLGKGERGSENL